LRNLAAELRNIVFSEAGLSDPAEPVSSVVAGARFDAQSLGRESHLKKQALNCVKACHLSEGLSAGLWRVATDLDLGCDVLVGGIGLVQLFEARQGFFSPARCFEDAAEAIDKLLFLRAGG